MLVYPNRMTFDIMPNGGNPPDPTGMLVLRIKSVSDIKGGSDWFSKVCAACFLKGHQGFVSSPSVR